MAPRGVGTMVAMMVAGRLANRIDPRLMMLVGFVMMAESAREMMGWTPDIDAWSLAYTTMLQGVGLGFVFMPLQVIAFATLPADLRTDGTSLFSLVRNVGCAIGISIASFLLAQNTQIMHAQIAERVTPFNRALQTGGAYLFWNSATRAGLSALNAEITRQAYDHRLYERLQADAAGRAAAGVPAIVDAQAARRAGNQRSRRGGRLDVKRQRRPCGRLCE